MRNMLLIYARRSVIKSTIDEINVDRQVARGIAEAEPRQWIPEVYVETGEHRSGRREKGRPVWLTVKAQFDRPDVAGLWVESLSRATRSLKDLSNLVDELDSKELVLLSAKEKTDTASAMGHAFIGFVGIMNQLESNLASERMAANIEFKRTEKGRHWGRTPFGCKRNTTDFVLQPSDEGIWWVGKNSTVVGSTDNAPFREGGGTEWRGYYEALERCYAWYAEGKNGLTTLGDRLNAAGYRFRDRKGIPRLFNKDDVRRLVAGNRIYAGYVLIGSAKDHPDEILKGNHSPILPLELCDRVAEILKARDVYSGDARGRCGPKQVYLLSELLYCSGCGRRMAGMFQDGSQFYRHERAKRDCPGKSEVKAAILDGQVMDRLSQFAMPDPSKERIAFLARKMMHCGMCQ